MGRFNLNTDDFERVRDEAEKFYHTLHSIYCPYFKEHIFFNAKGLRHIKFKSDQRARPHQDQYPRLKLVRLAPEVLKRSNTLQGIWSTKIFEFQKNNSRWDHILRDVTFYEFIAVLEEVRVKVIVKEVYGGEKYFWSIIPHWGIDTQNHKRILHAGNPEHD